MLDISFWEVGVVLIVAVLLLGPERLPKAARAVGRWIGKVRRLWAKVKNDLEKEFDQSSER